MGVTTIEWCDRSWPVINGCRRVSPGCGGPDGGGCYAERLTATRLKHLPKYEGLATMTPSGPRWTGKARLWRPALDEPLRVKKPCRWFVCDMGDLFFEEVTDEEIAAVFGVMAACPQHTFQCLTKRPKRMLEWFRWIAGKAELARQVYPSDSDVWRTINLARNRARHFGVAIDTFPFGHETWPLPNVHVGVSAEDQQRADERIPLLLNTPAAVRWVSAEPLIEAVDLRRFLPGHCASCGGVVPTTGPGAYVCSACEWCTDGGFLDWCVVGGESGPGARPFDLAWARTIVAECRSSGTSCFVKQIGARPVFDVPGRKLKQEFGAHDPKGADMAYWPEDLRVREYPTMASGAPETVTA